MEPRRFVSRRQRAMELEARMLKLSSIYNAAALLRDSWHGPAARRMHCAKQWAEVVAQELQRGSDPEAAVYAVADALYCSPLGVPWEA